MKNHSLLFFSIFICSLVLGYSVSTRFYPANLDRFSGRVRLAAAESRPSIASLDNGQRSILLISTTSINTPRPHLESIWLATYFASDTTIRLLPIFPTGKPQAADFEQRLDISFNVEQGNGERVLAQDFLDVLKNDNYWWSGYIVVDEVALTRMLNLMGGIELYGRTLSGEQTVNDLSNTSVGSPAAYSSQVAVLQSACRKFQEMPANVDTLQLITLLSNHIYTDLDSNQLQSEMQSLFSNQRKPTCRFPTLEISQVVQ